MFKVPEQDYSLRSCDGVQNFFQTMISDSNNAKGSTMLRQKASYIVFHGLGRLLRKRLVNDTALSEGTFTVMFVETTAVQNKKQTDVSIRY